MSQYPPNLSYVEVDKAVGLDSIDKAVSHHSGSHYQNEAATRNQVNWRQDSVATDFLGRDRNADNTRNMVATRTNRHVVAT